MPGSTFLPSLVPDPPGGRPRPLSPGQSPILPPTLSVEAIPRVEDVPGEMTLRGRSNPMMMNVFPFTTSGPSGQQAPMSTPLPPSLETPPSWLRPLAVVALPLAASLLACLVAFLFGVDAREAFSGRTLAIASSHALAIGIPLGLFLPWLTRAIPRPGPRLLLALAGGALVLAALGCLLAGGLLVASGILPAPRMWRLFGWNLRLAGLLALCSALGALAYETLAGRLRVAEDRLRREELGRAEASRLAAQAQLALLASRIHPHFLFNTLNAIASLVPTAPDRAERLVGSLADLLRTSLDMGSRPFVPLSEELALVRATLEIESARSGELRFDLGDPGGHADWPVPPHAIQGLVENAVKHGLAPRNRGGSIALAFRPEEGALRIEVRDDGPGFDLTALLPGHGLENLIARLESLYGETGRLEIAREEGGCLVSLVLPGAP